MPQTVIENPIINSPFAMPQRHFRHDDHGITPEIVEGRRKSLYVTPVPGPKKTGGQLALFEEKPKDNELINQVCTYVDNWRRADYPHVTQTTRRLLHYWQRPDRERKLFFCQIEAFETAIYLTEAVGRIRVAVKMATGSGKTVVMAGAIHGEDRGQGHQPLW